jgi:hypothetical protein
MQKQLTILFIALGFFINAQSTFNYKTDFKTVLNKTKDPKDKWHYDKLLKRFKKNDSTLTNADVLALLIGFTIKPDYRPYEDLIEEKKIYDLNAEGKYEDALIKADEFIKTHPLSIKVLFERSFAYYKARMEDSARIFSSQGNKIFKAMKYSGNGQSLQSPIFALGPEDGQEYIIKYLGSGFGLNASLKDENANSVEAIEVVSKVREPYNVYFVIQHATGKMVETVQPVNVIEAEKKEKARSNK